MNVLRWTIPLLLLFILAWLSPKPFSRDHGWTPLFKGRDHSSQWENGRALSLTEGRLQIQSEGAEVFYKQIMMGSLDTLPRTKLEPETVNSDR
jgi:hypothetical protein